MSFALEYRKKMQQEAAVAAAGEATRDASKKSRAGDFVLQPAKKDVNTRANRRRTLAALSLAGIILSVFNSGGMVQYTGNLSYNDLSIRIITASEDWHQLMEENRMTLVVDEIRNAVMIARHSSWQDLAMGLSLEPTHPYLGGGSETPSGDEQALEPVDSPQTLPEPEDETPDSAARVLRAAAEGR